MNKIKRTIFIAGIVLLAQCSAFCENTLYKNTLRSDFLDNKTIIMEINMRSFNAKDLNGDGFIQSNAQEIPGNFLNAIERLDELKNLGINTIHLLPITPVGKLKALGTSGSLYAISDFNSLNPELADKNSTLTVEEQAKEFIKQAHKRNIRIIADVPACGSYDLFLQRPDLFVTTNISEPVTPSDWTDVRLLETGTEEKINPNVYALYKDFVKYMIKLGVDGIRADVAHCKTALFWKNLIEYSRKKDPEFLWIAESSESLSEAVSPKGVFTSYDKLLEAGFDGYYGSFFNIKDWKYAKDLYSQIGFTLGETKKFKDKKSVIGSFTTHDEVSPILLKGEEFSNMIIWLNSTLPINSYYVDGFQTGDTYLYSKGNKPADETSTDDEIYFTHRGKIDIFNPSRKPGGNNIQIKNNLILGNDVKKSLLPVLNNGNFTPLTTKNKNVFAYMFENNNKKIITFGNLNFNQEEKTIIKIPKYNNKSNVIPIKISSMPPIRHGKIETTLGAGEIVVLVIND